ncbi:MAG: hypothetical protein ACE5F1_15970 [Planctomycetota bacterium]
MTDSEPLAVPMEGGPLDFSPSFVIRPWALVATTNAFHSRAIDVRNRLGILLRVEVEGLSGTSPSLAISIQRSLDKISWVTIEGTVSISSAMGLDIERHQLGAWMRIQQQLSGSASPTVLYRIKGTWLDYHQYRVNGSASWDGPPLTAGLDANFSVQGLVPAADIAWTATYKDNGNIVGTDSGSANAENDGTYSGISTVPLGAAGGTAILAVETIGLSLSDTASVV